MKPAKKIDLPGISWMEPMLPSDGNKASEDMAFDLVANANALAGQIHPMVTESVGDLVRSMNCYYSNLIEGHDTHRATSTAPSTRIIPQNPASEHCNWKQSLISQSAGD